LEQLERIEKDFFERVLKKQRPAAPLWPAPRLDDVPMPIITRPPAVPEPVGVALPGDPWTPIPPFGGART